MEQIQIGMDEDVIQQGVHLSWQTHFFSIWQRKFAERKGNSGGVGIMKRVVKV